MWIFQINVLSTHKLEYLILSTICKQLKFCDSHIFHNTLNLSLFIFTTQRKHQCLNLRTHYYIVIFKISS